MREATTKLRTSVMAMVGDSSQDAQIIVDLYDTRIAKTIGFNAKGKGFNRGNTAFAYRTRKAFASVARKDRPFLSSRRKK